jgi:hypothetical protein
MAQSEADAETADLTVIVSVFMPGLETLDVWDGSFPESQAEIIIDGGVE